MAEARQAKVIPFPDLIELRSQEDAIRWGDKWMRYAEKMEMLYELAGIQRDAIGGLLADALRECERLREILK